MKIMTQKLKVASLIFIENFENNKSKMVFPQKQGGGSGPLENSTKKCFFKPCLREVKVHWWLTRLYGHC